MTVTLNATKRENLAKSATKEIRNNGKVPAIVYGKGKEPKTVAVDSIELIKTVRDEGRNAIISLNIDGDDSVDVMLHDYQADPIKDLLVHADFYVVNMSEDMDISIPLRLEGEAPGAKAGGVLQQPLFEVMVRAKPGQFPEEISVDVSSLEEVGDSLTVSDLPKGKGYEILEDAESTVATVVPPAAEEPETSEVSEEGDAEPELVGAAGNEEEEK